MICYKMTNKFVCKGGQIYVFKRGPKSVFLYKVAKNVCRTKERRARRQAAKKVTPLKMLTAEKTAYYKRAHQMLRGPWTAEASLYL